MSRGFSVYLDAIRFAAAFMVLISHLAYPRFTRGDLQFFRQWDLGRDAVIIFFVLSGLVIAYAAERDGNWERFVFNRVTRLYSVMAPALLLTILLDLTGQFIYPEGYNGWWYAEISAPEFLTRGLTFSNQWLFDPIRLGTNGPLWSISYEVSYYLLFGIALFASGPLRVALIIVILMLAGPRVLLLMPPWLCGVLVWRAIKQEPDQMSHNSALVCASLFPIFYVLSVAIGVPEYLTDVSELVSARIYPNVALGFSDKFLWHTVIGVIFALHLAAMARLLQRVRSVKSGDVIRWLAGASFTVYVLHYPLLQFVHALLPSGIPGRDVLLLGIVLIGCFAVAEVTERRLKGLRAFIGKLRSRSA